MTHKSWKNDGILKKKYCEEDLNKDYNPLTNRCLIKCTPNKIRNEKQRCISNKNKTKKNIKDNILRCLKQNKIYNPMSKRCLKKCRDTEIRNKNFKCVKIKSTPLIFPKIEYANTTDDEIKDFYSFLHILNKTGEKYQQEGILYRGFNIFTILFNLYLIKKYNSKCFMYVKSKQHDKSILFNIGDSKEIYNFKEIVNKNTFVVSTFVRQFFNCLKNSNSEVIVIPIGFKITHNGISISHANMLMYRKHIGIIEHFDPSGAPANFESVYLFMADLIKLINKKNKESKYSYYEENIIYFQPFESCINHKGIQDIEESIIPTLPKEIEENEGKGFCILWSLFFAELSFLNPKMRNYEILNKVYELLDKNNKKDGFFIRNIIRGYLHFMYICITKYILFNYDLNYDFNDVNFLRTFVSNTKLKNKIVGDIYKKIENQEFLNYYGVDFNEYFNNSNVNIQV